MNWIVCSLVGLGSGLLASMGLGGGFIMVLYLAIFTDIAQQNAQGINLLFFIPIIVLSVILHLKNKLIDVPTALRCGLTGALFAVGGYYIAQAVEGEWLRRGFAVFVILAGLKDLLSRSGSKDG
ncbi:MAG: sulfite exporter TauE/SafE family protein [Oscillospiraceae bacterium]|nr:sulfite exporter TauE/SafE family protein [Oscillospiraceae bacterium]